MKTDKHNPNWGGKRLISGRFQRNINLSPETARELDLLFKQHKALNPEITKDQIVENLIHASWQELDRDIIRGSDVVNS